jgi:hypothetical protein
MRAPHCTSPTPVCANRRFLDDPARRSSVQRFPSIARRRQARAPNRTRPKTAASSRDPTARKTRELREGGGIAAPRVPSSTSLAMSQTA